MSSAVRGERWPRSGDNCQGCRAEKLSHPTQRPDQGALARHLWNSRLEQETIDLAVSGSTRREPARR